MIGPAFHRLSKLATYPSTLTADKKISQYNLVRFYSHSFSGIGYCQSVWPLTFQSCRWRHLRISKCPRNFISRQMAVRSSTPLNRHIQRKTKILFLSLDCRYRKKDSARQVTSGLYKDELPRWSPDGKHIAFVSDRANRGKCSTVYLMAMKTLGGEPFPITDPQHEKQIVSFEWSLNGAFIAFLSENEKTAEKKRKEEEKDDAKVYGTDWNYQRLRLIHVETRQVTTMVQGDQHVNSFSWSRDSKLIAYTVHQIPDINSAALHGCEIHILNLATRATRSFFSFSGPIKSLVWGSPEFIYFIAGVTPKKSTTSSCVYRLNVKTEEFNTYFGITDCAMALCDGRQCMIVRVQSAESDMLYALGPWETPLSRLHQSLCDITAFDVLWDPKDDDLSSVTLSVMLPNQMRSVRSKCMVDSGVFGANFLVIIQPLVRWDYPSPGKSLLVLRMDNSLTVFCLHHKLQDLIRQWLWFMAGPTIGLPNHSRFVTT